MLKKSVKLLNEELAGISDNPKVVVVDSGFNPNPGPNVLNDVVPFSFAQENKVRLISEESSIAEWDNNNEIEQSGNHTEYIPPEEPETELLVVDNPIVVDTSRILEKKIFLPPVDMILSPVMVKAVATAEVKNRGGKFGPGPSNKVPSSRGRHIFKIHPEREGRNV